MSFSSTPVWKQCSTVSTFEQPPACKKKNNKSTCGKCETYVHRLSNAMVQCDYCDQWYHYKCVGITAKEAETMDFVCPS